MPDDPDFFQIINYAMNQANGGASDPNHVQTRSLSERRLIDQYDAEDLYDADPNPPGQRQPGNTITIIDTVGNGNPANYVYGIEGMSFDDPTSESGPTAVRAESAACCRQDYAVLLNRRFENVGEFGYAYNPASTLASKTLDFCVCDK